MSTGQSVLELSFKIGEILLENGAEISRVQETMERIAKALNADEFHVYVLTNAIFATGTEKGVVQSTELRFIKNTRLHLGRISAANQLSREIEAGKVDLESAFLKIPEIAAIPYTSLPIATICCALASGCFSILFGGSPIDAAVAALCGCMLEPFLFLAEKKKLSKFLLNLIASAMIALLACFCFSVGFGENIDKITIGTLIRLVPGVALTNSIRDFLSGDYLSGAIRMIDAILIGLFIGIGVGSVILLYQLLFGGMII